jgi:dienelactone hydrolase
MLSPEGMAVLSLNCMRGLRDSAMVLLAMALLVSLANGAARDERPFTVDDLLKLSDVGRATVRPGTDTFVWEQSPPYDTLGDYGAGTTGTWQGSDHEIWAAGAGLARPKMLFKPQARTTYVLGSFSSDGRFLSLLACHDGKVGLAVYDFRRMQLKEYSLSPRYELSGPEWAWVDSRHLAVAAYLPGSGPWPLTFRRAVGDRLTKSWEKSWKGKEPSVDQYDSSAQDAIQPLPGRLVIVDLVSGHISQLASGQFASLHPSPDGRWLAAVRQSKLPQSTLEHPHVDWTLERSALTVFSLIGKPIERSAAPDLVVLPDAIAWNPSSKNVAFFGTRSGESFRSGNYRVFDPSDAAITMVPHTGLSLVSQRARGGEGWPERAVWFKDSLAVFARSTPGQPGTLAFDDIERYGVVDSRAPEISVPPHWYLLSQSSAPYDLTPAMQTISPVPVSADGAHFIVVGDGQAWSLNASAPPLRLFPQFLQRLDTQTGRDLFQVRTIGGEGFFPIVGETGKLARVDVEDGIPVLKRVTAPPRTLILAIAKSGAAFGQIGAGKGAELAIIGPDGELKVLSNLNPFLEQVAETRWTDFNYLNAEGSQRDHLSGCLLLPPDYQSRHKYPLIVEVYPNRPGGCGAPRLYNRYAMAAHPGAYSEHLLAAQGFIVFRPDTGGGISRTADGPQAALSTVVDRGVDALLAAGYGDPTRVGLMGISQGGFASLWVATQSHRYKAVVSLNGWTDPANNFFGMSLAQEFVPSEMPSEGDSERYLMPAGTDWYMGDTPWKAPQRYVANSPLWHSDNVSAAALLIHSDMDGFDDLSYKQFFTSLYIQKKYARLLIYRGEGHSPSSPANIRHMWKNIFSWFDRYLDIRRDSTGAIVLDE